MVDLVEAFMVHKSYIIKDGSVENIKSGIVKYFKHEHNYMMTTILQNIQIL